MGMVGLRKENMSEHVDFDFELGNMMFTFEEKIRLPQTNERGFYTDIMNHDPEHAQTIPNGQYTSNFSKHGQTHALTVYISKQILLLPILISFFEGQGSFTTITNPRKHRIIINHLGFERTMRVT